MPPGSRSLKNMRKKTNGKLRGQLHADTESQKDRCTLPAPAAQRSGTGSTAIWPPPGPRSLRLGYILQSLSGKFSVMR